MLEYWEAKFDERAVPFFLALLPVIDGLKVEI